MQRFVALVWDAANPRTTATAQTCEALLDGAGLIGRWGQPGLCVRHNWPTVGPLICREFPERRAVAFGALFEHACGGCDNSRRATRASSVGLPPAVFGLHDRYWGTFVAFEHDAHTQTCSVSRSLGAGIACYWLSWQGVDIFFSDLADLCAMRLTHLGVNWSYLAAFLEDTNVAVADSALVGVSEVLAGEVVHLGGPRQERCMWWSPNGAMSRGAILDPAVAESQLRQTTLDCVRAWAARHDRILLHLSGGFDSAVVLGCINRGSRGPTLEALNRYGDSAGEDERRFARAAAVRAAVRLEERPWADDDIDFHARLVELPIAPKPTIPALLMIETRVRNELMCRCQAQACWTGQGGDHLFYQFRTAAMVADFARARGVRAPILAVIGDAARLTRRPYLRMMSLALRSRWSAKPVPDREAQTRPIAFVSATATGIRGKATTHPWDGEILEMPPGKQLQTRALIELLQRHAPFCRDEPGADVHPLISQPLIEVSLRIPTWLALHGGCGRALARKAFRKTVPRLIRERRTKGATSRFLASVIRRDARLLRPLLLDGFLAKSGLIDRAAIDRHLGQSQPLRSGELLPLLGCVAAEVWLRGCQRSGLAP